MSSRFGGWRASLGLAAIATVLGAVVLALVGEWAIRYRERNRESVPGTMSMIFYRHNRLGYALVRDYNYFGWVHVGRQGFRGTAEVDPRPADSVIRIIAVGGSTTFDGNTSGDSSAWPARLERALNATAGGRRYEVLNAGVPGYMLFDDLVRLEYELYQYRPTAIILYQGHNDLFYALASAASGSTEAPFVARPDEIDNGFPGRDWLERNSLLFHKLRSRLEALQINAAGKRNSEAAVVTQYGEALNDGVKRFGRDLRAFLAVANAWGIKVIVPQVVYAARSTPGARADTAGEMLWNRAFLFAPRETVWAGYARIDSIARAAAATFGAVHIPARDSSLWLIESYVEGDPIHFNDRGADRWARHLAQVLATPTIQGWIRKP